jgi:hypothetical protein
VGGKEEREVKYKVGDKVMVRKDLEIGELASGMRVTNEMAKLKGLSVTITGIEHERYRIKETFYFWTDEMFDGLAEEKEESKVIYASELMELARKEPQKYEGKRYKVRDTLIDRHGKEYETAIFKSGNLRTYGGNMLFAHANSMTQLEEIPQPIPFDEAVKAAIDGKKPAITLGGSRYTLTAKRSTLSGIGYWLEVTYDDDPAELSTGMIDGMWTVEE